MKCQHCRDAIMTYMKTEFEAEAKQGTNLRLPNQISVSIYDKYECPNCETQLQTKTERTYELKK